VVTGELFSEGDEGDTMFIVATGTLTARRDGTERRIKVGDVVGELAVLTRAKRAATLSAVGEAGVLVVDRAAFTTVARRAPELVLGLSATLASWLAPSRPDVL
jgi:CRP-like cAMP-binding protein